MTKDEIVKELNVIGFTDKHVLDVINNMADGALWMQNRLSNEKLDERKTVANANAIRIQDVRGKQCIILPQIGGGEFALYPHYGEHPLIEKERLSYYNDIEMTEVDAIYDTDCKGHTDRLISVDSPAAIFCRQFGFDVPTLGQVMSIVRHINEINELAVTIGGDVLEKISLWSCCRYSASNAWPYYSGGITNYYYFHLQFAVSPVSAL